VEQGSNVAHGNASAGFVSTNVRIRKDLKLAAKLHAADPINKTSLARLVNEGLELRLAQVIGEGSKRESAS